MGLGYLIPLMWACLSIAALIGALCTGFWLSSVNVRKRESLKQSFSAKLRQSEQDRDTRIARLTSEIDHYRNQTPTLETSLAERSALIVAQESELEARRKSVTRITQELAVERQLVAEAQAGKVDIAQRVVALEEALASAQQDCTGLQDTLTDEQQRRTELQEALTGVQQSRTELEARLDELTQENGTLLTRRQRDADELGNIRSEAQRQAASFETIKQELEHKQTDLKSLQQNLADRERELRVMTQASEAAERKMADVSELEKTVENLKQELVNRRSEISSSQDALQSWQHKCGDLLAAQKERDDKLSAVESEIQHWQKRHDDLASDARTNHQPDREGENARSDRVARLLNENQKLARALKRAQRTARSQDLHGEKRQPHVSATPAQAEWLMSVAPAVPDDLQKIRGIGPVMEKTLNELGIYLFRQLAALRKEDIDWVASHLNTFPGRIKRDQWISQATELHDLKATR